MIVPVGADQVGQHLGIGCVGLGPGAVMAAAVAADHMPVDRTDLVASGHQGPDQQASVGRDPDRHLPGLLRMGGHQPMQLPHPGQPIGDPVSCQDTAVLVQQASVMVDLSQSSPTNNTASSSAPTSP
jgi:hypothetical protein